MEGGREGGRKGGREGAREEDGDLGRFRLREGNVVMSRASDVQLVDCDAAHTSHAVKLAAPHERTFHMANANTFCTRDTLHLA